MTHELFISYARTDTPWVEGYLLPALDLPADQVLTPQDFELGIPVVTAFEQAISQSRYTLLILSPAYLADEWAQFSEQLASFARVTNGQQRLIPLYLKPCTLPLHLDFLVRLDCTEEANWVNEITQLRTLLAQPAPVAKQIPCPYPGMVPFTEVNAGRFFGREPEIENLRHKLRHQDFLLVIGPSGSGKSSLVFAGLGPALQKQEPSRWQIRAMRPGVDPCATLKATVGDLVDLQTFQSKTQCSEQVTLLIIDQFEEIFVQAPKSEQVAFIAMVKSLHQAKACKLVLTLRADFFPDLMNSDLWPIDPSQREEIAPLHGDALRRAILQPATGVGVFLEPGLVERLLADAADEPGVLPLLQETLVLLWEKRIQRFLPLSTYSQLGTASQSGLAIALANKADATLAVLTPDQQNIARRIFLRLVQFGEGRPDTRRQQTVTALQNAEEDETIFKYVLSHLADNRLLTLTKDESGHEQRVDISHEKLITGWPRLQIWLKEHKEAEQLRRRLEEKAQEWVRMGKRGGGLLDVTELQEADLWLKTAAYTDLGASKVLLELVQTSRKLINPGWHKKGAIALAISALALIAFVALLLILIATWPWPLRIAAICSMAIIIILLLWLAGLIRRDAPYRLQHLSQATARQRLIQVLLFFLTLGTLAIWFIFGISVTRTVAYCNSQGYIADPNKPVRIAVNGRDTDPFYIQLVIDELNNQPEIDTWLVSPEDMKRCMNSFTHFVEVQRESPPGGKEVGYGAYVRTNYAGDAIHEVVIRNQEQCDMFAELGQKVVKHSGIESQIELSKQKGQLQIKSCQAFMLNQEGWKAYQQKEYQYAESSLRKAVELEPDFATAHNTLGVILLKVENYEDARSEFTKAVELWPDNGLFLVTLGNSCYRLADYRCGEKSYQDAIKSEKVNPTFPNVIVEAYNNLGVLYRDWGKIAESEKFFRETANIIPTLPNLQERDMYQTVLEMNQGILRFQEGKWQEAIDLLTKADISAQSQEWKEKIVFYLAMAYEGVKNSSKACEQWKRYNLIPEDNLFKEHERRKNAMLHQRVLNCQTVN